MTFHQTIIIGNLGSDPELKQLPSGTAVTNFSVAVNESWTDRQTNERREKTTWYRVAVYGRQAETVAQYLTKGRQVMVTGNVEARGYMNQNGEPAASLELRARDVRFLSGGESGGGGGGFRDNRGGGGGNRQNDDYQDDYSPPPQDIGDIPF